MSDHHKRGSFGSNIGFLMAAVGSAVGLGNIWGFPYKMGNNGGFVFLLVYLILAVFVGVCVMMGEMAIGRKTRQGSAGAYRAISQKFSWLGWLAVIAGFVILCFYLVLGGMVLRYAVGYFLAMFGVDTFGDPASFFGSFLTNGWSMVIFFALFAVINAAIVMGGVEGGIERFNKFAMPALFFLLLIVLIYVACQPGAGEGYRYIFGVNFEPLKTDFLGVVKTAAGQMFFSLSLGMAIMLTYGSYLPTEENIQKDTLIIVIFDTLIAIMAGMVVLPACSAFGLDYGAGPGLLFSTMQMVFYNMGGFIGNLMGFLFYVLVFLAAISSSISIMEGTVATRVDKNFKQNKGGKSGGRRRAALLITLAALVLGLPVALDGLGSGVAGGALVDAPATILNIAVHGWNDCWLDLYDMISEGILMPLGSLIMALCIGWGWGTDMILDECAKCGAKPWGRKFFEICYKVITPIGMLIVLYGQIMSFFG